MRARFIACAAAALLFLPPSAPLAETVARNSQPLTVLKSTIWADSTIPVCWENPSPTNAVARTWTRDAVAATWERETGVRFVGWDQCAPKSRGIRIVWSSEGPHVVALGSALDGVANGMHLNLDFKTWGESCQNGGELPPGFNQPNRIASASEVEYCVKAIAVHEFGHALGAAHEHNRADKFDCTKEPQGPNGDFNVTEYDANSIMNYCVPTWNGAGLLSSLDIEGMVSIYGRSPQTPANVASSIAAVSPVAGGASVFTVGEQGNVWSFYFDPRIAAPAWSPAFRLSATETSAANTVTAVSPVTGGVSLFTISARGDVLSAYFDPRVRNEWSRWFSLGGSAQVRPGAKVTAVTTVAGGVSLFAVGRDNAVWSAYYDPRQSAPRWSDWFSLGGGVRSGGGVAAVSAVEGGVSLFVVGPDNTVYTNYFDPRVKNAWSGWLPLGGTVRRGADVVAVTPKRGAVSLFSVGADNRVMSAYFDPDVPQPAWSNWFGLGGEVRSDGTVAAVSPAPGAVSLFIRGRDGAVWSAFYDPRQPAARWSEWFSLGGAVRNRQDIVAISPIQSGVSLFQRGDDGHVQSAYYDPRVRNPRWSEWFALGR